MRKSWIACFVLGAVAVSAVSAQIVPQQKQSPPLFRGEKKPKDEDGKTRNLSGTVKNEQEAPVPGAVVQLKDTKSLQVRSFITKDDGVYHFYGLSTDIDYQVKADSKGQSSDVKTLSVFNSTKNAVIHLKLEAKK
jgi:hypothetical protein